MILLHILLFLCGSSLYAQTTLTLADFETDSLAGWSTSMSPEYYKGHTGQKGLQILRDAQRGNVLAADIRFVDPTKSEPCFITYQLPQPLPLFRLRSVSFYYKLANCPRLESFKVRLRTSETEFNDYDVRPVYGQWTHCVIDTKDSTKIRNIWSKIFSDVKQLTFRLDDIDTENAHFTLFVDDIVVTMDYSGQETYSPHTLPLRRDERLDVLLLHHAAASPSTYWLPQSWTTIDPQYRLRTFPFKGLHFGLDLFGFPAHWDELLNTDLIVFLDVDPFILSTEQATGLANLVYSGAGLIFYGGQETLARSRDFKRPLADCLPAAFVPGEAQLTSRVASRATPHFITEGLTNEDLGVAAYTQKLTAKEDAVLVLKGEERPLLLVREFGQGRVALVNAQPNLDADKDFFAMPACAQLTQRLMQWAVRRETQKLPPPTLERDMPPATPPPPAPLKQKNFFPIITMAGSGASGHWLSLGDLRKEVEAVKKAGFNTIAFGGLSALARLKPEERPSAQIRNTWALQRLAYELGLATIYEYTSFNLVGNNVPTQPCVFAPEYPEALAEKLQPQIEAAQRTPNLLSVKILDEPTVSPASMDYCEHCQRVFRQRYGIPLRKFEDIPPEAFYERWAFADFLGHYVAEGYRQGWELKQKSSAAFDLLLTYMSTGLGYGRPLTNQEDALDWSRWADRIDFDVYPYFYPDSQKIRMLRAAYCMAFIRQIAWHLHKPWGFYFELDDRNWPFQKNPKEASAECAYEALLHGVNYLNSFIHLPFGTGNDARPERWAWTAQELRKINKLGPLLTQLARPAANVAFLYPTAQTFITNNPAAQPYAFACVSQGFGNVDILPEEIALEQKKLSYKALLLLGCDILHEQMIQLLEQWLKAGGTLILDKMPTMNHKGETIRLPVSFAPAAREPQIRSFGRGRIIMLPFDLEAAYSEAVENDKPAEAARLRHLMARLLLPLQASFCVADPKAQMEVGVRKNKEMALVIVVNHDPQENTGTVIVRDLGFKPLWARWLFNGRGGVTPIKLKPAGKEAYSFTARLPGRQAALILLAPRAWPNLSMLNKN